MSTHDPLLERTVAQIRRHFGGGVTAPPEGTVDDWGRYQASRDKTVYLIDLCLRAGMTVRQLADASGVAGYLLISMVDDRQRRAQAYQTEILHLERQLEAVRADQRASACAECAEGALLTQAQARAMGLTKTAIADRYGISRVTLDAWIAAEPERAIAPR